MLSNLKKTANVTYTENGGLTYKTSGTDCLDLFFRAGGMRNADKDMIEDVVVRAFAEDPVKTLKILFFIRDVRGGLGERRFFRIAIAMLARTDAAAVIRNIPYIAEYGRYDDLVTLLGTACNDAVVSEIKKQLDADTEAYNNGGQVSLLAKWLPSVNASSKEVRNTARKLAALLGMSEIAYRKRLVALRKYSDILENRLRERDYTFDYSKQPSCAMLKYRNAFIRNDGERYNDFLESVNKGEAKLNTAAIYPYQIVHKCIEMNRCQYRYGGVLSPEQIETERKALDTAWKNLPGFGADDMNAIAVVDGSGSMYCDYYNRGSVTPGDAALSLGIYFAEHNKGAFANHFITFSQTPQLVEIKGSDILEKTRYCMSYNEVANTNIEAVFQLILSTAVKNKVPKKEMPKRLYIISDMEFDYCVDNGSKQTVFNKMKLQYKLHGYELPEVVFWNVASRHSNIPVTASETGAALVSGFSPAIFDMVVDGEISPVKIMDDIIGSERYARIA